VPRRLAIQTLTTESILAEIRGALSGGLNATRIADFLASVDWSGTLNSPDDDPVIAMLGKLDNWESEFGEGDITAEEYIERLRSLITSRV
jgi:hypothetical protein